MFVYLMVSGEVNGFAFKYIVFVYLMVPCEVNWFTFK